MAEKFRHLEAPYSFKAYYSKYPEGYSIFEALLNWLDEVNKMIDTLNITLEEWSNLKTWVNEELKVYAQEQLEEWLTDGTLEDIINEVLFNSKLDVSTFEAYQVAQSALDANQQAQLENLSNTKIDMQDLNTALTPVNTEIDTLNEYVDKTKPILFDGTQTLQATIEQAVAEDRIIQIGYGEFEIFENVVVECGNRNLVIRGYGKSTSHPVSRLVFRNVGLALKLNDCQNLVLEDCDFVTQTVGESPYIIPTDKQFCETSGSIKATNIFIRGFNTLFKWIGGYYHVFERCNFSHFNIGFASWSVHNVNFSLCNFQMFATLLQASGGSGPLTFNQCVFETFSTRLVNSMNSTEVVCSVNITNSYIENGVRELASGLTGTYGNAGIVLGCGPITFIGNFIYGNNLGRVFSITASNKSIVSLNNSYIFPETPVNVPDYIFYQMTTLDVAIISDVITSGTTASTFGSGMSGPIGKGASRIYDMISKTMLT